jgi:hypothetical protein
MDMDVESEALGTTVDPVATGSTEASRGSGGSITVMPKRDITTLGTAETRASV